MERKGKASGGSYEVAVAAHLVVCVVCVVGRFTIEVATKLVKLLI